MAILITKRDFRSSQVLQSGLVALVACGCAALLLNVWCNRPVKMLRRLKFDVPNAGRMPDLPSLAVYRTAAFRNRTITDEDLNAGIDLLNQVRDIRSIDFSKVELTPVQLRALKNARYIKSLSLNCANFRGRDVRQLICSRPDLWRINLIGNQFPVEDAALLRVEADRMRTERGSSTQPCVVVLVASRAECDDVNRRPEFADMLMYTAW